MTNKDILEQVRSKMRTEKIDAVIFPTSDPHNSEYLPEHWQTRRWITGFTGSAGTAVVTLDEAALWTDSRYFLQAEQQLAMHSSSSVIGRTTGATLAEQEALRQAELGAQSIKPQTFVLMREGVEGTPTITEWLLRKLSASNGRVVAAHGMVMNYSTVKALEGALRRIGVSVRTDIDIADGLWRERPALPAKPVYAVGKEWIGESVESKLGRIREVMKREHCDAHVITDLMGIAWTLNLRGDDVKMTPVFMSYLLITLDDATLFANGALSEEASAMLREADVKVKPYEDFTKEVAQLDGRVLIDPATTNYTVFSKCKEHAIEGESPVTGFKAVKNAREIEGFRQAMLYDGVAMVKFLRWLKPAVEQGGETEISVADKLEELRRENEHCLDLSFSTICGYNEHGAIVHYSATPETNAELKPTGLVLIDSGAQYDCGTTDITRTIALGPVTEEMKRAYTCVLKANIALATTPFPDGTNGTQIDALARAEVWRGGYNYLHGTGHGVGWRLCVHEGPHAIRMDWRPAPLRPGMVVTDEPGIYLEGQFGIRTENVMVVTQVHNSQFLRSSRCSGEQSSEHSSNHSTNSLKTVNCELCTMNCLTPLTLCPIDTTPIDKSLLTTAEVEWLNQYHKTVRDALLPLLSDAQDRQWLTEATQPLPSC